MILRIALHDPITSVHMKNGELGPSFPKSSLEFANSRSAPNPDELGLATGVCQDHLATEEDLELIPPNVSFDEAALAVNMTPFTSL
jgi:hypothetical protein